MASVTAARSARRKDGAADPARRARQAAAQPHAGRVPARAAPVRRASRAALEVDRGARCWRASSELLDERIIRQVTPIFDTRALGYGSMLVAAKVDPEHPWRAGEDHQRAPRRLATTTCATTSSTCGSRSPSSRTPRSACRARSTCSQELDRRRVDPPAADAEAVQDPHGPRDGGRHRRAGHGRRGRRARRARASSPTTSSTCAVIRATQGDLPVVAEPYAPAAARARHDASTQLLEHLRGMQRARPAAPRRRDPLPPPRRLQRQRHGRLEGARRARSPRSARGWPPSAASRTATSARPTRTGPTRSSRWPTGARRRSATRSSTRSPTRSPGSRTARRCTRSTEFKKIRLLYFTDDFKATGNASTRGA